MSNLIESTEDWDIYQTPHGKLTVFKRDVTKGDLKGKAFTSVMEYTDPRPRLMDVKKKYKPS
tara:strand:+ start:767 stop:952 length:186 start_codon:yes stop_codon:yes gene_type:complete